MNENKIWFLATCDTCKRIIKELELKEKDFVFQNIREENILREELDEIHKVSKLSYEELFNKRSRKYEKNMFKSDLEFREAILNEDTFLKRPIIRFKNEYFVGNSKNIIEILKKKLKN